MSLTQDHGDHVFECDTCKATLETGTSNFDSARSILRRQQWRPVPRPRSDRRFIAGEVQWNHVCRDCDRGGSLPLAHNKSRSEQAGAS